MRAGAALPREAPTSPGHPKAELSQAGRRLEGAQPAAPLPTVCPPSTQLPCSAAGAEPCPLLAPPPASPPLRSRSRGAPPAPSPPPLPAPAPAPGPSSPRGTLAAPGDATGKKKKKPTKVAAREVPGAGRSWGRGRRALPGGAAERDRELLPSAIALFILGVGEGTSGGAKWSGSGTILGKSGADPGAKLQPERAAAAHGEGGALPVPAPSLIGGMSSPRAGVSIQARLPLPASPRLASPASSSLGPPAARSGPGLRRIRGAERSRLRWIPGASGERAAMERR